MNSKVLLAVIMLMNVVFAGLAEKRNEFAGQGTLMGKVTDASSGEPMEYVTLALRSLSDSSVVSGSVTDSEGKFEIKGIENGKYFLEINFLGFEKKIISSIVISKQSGKIDLGNIELRPVDTKLNEVVVTGEKAKIEYQLDKRIVNVDKNLEAQGGNAVDALENTPSVQVDAQRNLTLRGSSDFVVLINGKPTVLKGSDALKQLPANAIKQIEVITNPSAKYDADGNAGIINIILKKDKSQGLNGSINATASFNDRQSANVLFNYRKNKLNFFGGIDYADNLYTNTIEINNITIRPEGNLSIYEDIYQFNYNQNKSLKLGFDYDLNDKNSFSISASAGRKGFDHGSDANMHFWDNSGTDDFSVSNNYMGVTGDVLDITADYSYKIAENHDLRISAVYGSWSGLDDLTLVVNETDNQYNPVSLSSQLNYTKDNFNYQFRANVDYTKPFKSGKLEAGLQYRYEYRMEDFVYNNYDISTGGWVENDEYSYYLNYYNDIYSGYATISGNLKGFNYQLGLRTEFFNRNIYVDTETDPYLYDKFMLYPTLHFSKQVKEKHQFQLSYGRRINRPQPWLLNTTPFYVDPNNIFMGNPNLKFEYVDAFEFNYRVGLKKVSLSTQTYLRNTTNAFTALRLMDENGIMTHLLVNAENQLSVGLEQNVDIELFKWWKLSANVNVYNYKLRTLISNSEKTQQVNTWDGRLVSGFNFKTSTRVQATAYYRAKGVDAMGETSGIYTINLAVNQGFLKGKLNLGITGQNLFNTLKFDYTVKTEQFDNCYSITEEGPIVLFNLSYNFNNFQQKNRGRNDDIDFKGGGGF
ncbi:MAG: TonB-dependent receptor [Bacteroidales bacterium]